ncbi:sulfate adenylyltransferase [Cyanobium sp. NS01]|uniref:sulfate adenylyltransferase n=1 Tax=Cyanobium sp. NS01 TaxID=261284 RepID=UPI001646678D|nr:sulfate adenylyltransferase [Cyanobium sp. NS01]QNI71731.1 sulfate adenylyltransferase [Cyanobium sp. NS01]
MTSSTLAGLIAPHGGTLVDLMVPAGEQEAVRAGVDRVLECSDRNACDVELLVVGGFSPLRGFMHQEDYDAVVAGHRTTSGLLFGLPIVFDTDEQSVAVGERLLLTYKGQDLAVLTVGSKWEPDKAREAQGCYGTTSIEHPAVRMISGERGRFYLGGRLQGLALPQRVFPCKTPAEVRATLPEGQSVVAFQCRNPIHRAHYELFTRALEASNVSEQAAVLVHPTCGPTQDDDIAGAVRFQTYERLAAEVNNPRIRWAYLPYSMHMAGPREALQHMIIRKNYGCTHFIIGRDMAGCKSSLSGSDFYGPYQAQDFARDNASELGMETVPSLNLVYTEEEGYVTAEHAEARGLHIRKLSGTQFRQMLRGGEEIPEWFAFRSVVEVLRAAA